MEAACVEDDGATGRRARRSAQDPARVSARAPVNSDNRPVARERCCNGVGDLVGRIGVGAKMENAGKTRRGKTRRGKTRRGRRVCVARF